jgi:hypothetical protein
MPRESQVEHEGFRSGHYAVPTSSDGRSAVATCRIGARSRSREKNMPWLLIASGWR